MSNSRIVSIVSNTNRIVTIIKGDFLSPMNIFLMIDYPMYLCMLCNFFWRRAHHSVSFRGGSSSSDPENAIQILNFASK